MTYTTPFTQPRGRARGNKRPLKTRRKRLISMILLNPLDLQFQKQRKRKDAWMRKMNEKAALLVKGI